MSRDYPALALRWPAAPADDHIERLLAAIDDDGPTAVEEREDEVRVFFATPDARARAQARLIALDPDLTCAPIDVPDEDWAARSQASLGPVRIGDIVVSPRKGENDPVGHFPGNDPGDRFPETIPGVVSPVHIYITPSMGFGTGHHASTRLCLALLQRVPVSGARVLDLGTGSGVLAIAAWRLGARDVVAADYDPDALTAAAENLELNGAAGAIRLAEVDLAHLPDAGDAALLPPFDLLMANLTGGLLIRHAPAIAARVAPGGRLVASGFQEDEVAAVTAAFSSAGLTGRERVDEDTWVGQTFERAMPTPTASRAR